MGGVGGLRDEARIGNGDGVGSDEMGDMARGVGRGFGDWPYEGDMVVYLTVGCCCPCWTLALCTMPPISQATDLVK